MLPLPLEELLDEEVRKRNIGDKNLIAYSFYSMLKGRMTLDVIIDVPLPFQDLWDRCK